VFYDKTASYSTIANGRNSDICQDIFVAGSDTGGSAALLGLPFEEQ